MNREDAELIVDKIINDLNDRRGCGIDSFDKEIQNEIRESWISIVMVKPIKKQQLKVINLAEYDDDTSSVEDVDKYIDEFIHCDCNDLIEDSYGDTLPDGGFNCKLYFLLNNKYYCVEIECGTRWEGGWSNRRNFIDGIKILSTNDFNVDLDKFNIKLI